MNKILLIALLTMPAYAQDLVSGDGTVWFYIATGRHTDGVKYNVFARRLKSDDYPALEIKAGEVVISAEHDCKRKLYRVKGADNWVKPKGGVGERLIKFACKSGR